MERLQLAKDCAIVVNFEKGEMDKKKICITCGGCAQLLRAGRPAGCVIRDREEYAL